MTTFTSSTIRKRATLRQKPPRLLGGHQQSLSTWQYKHLKRARAAEELTSHVYCQPLTVQCLPTNGCKTTRPHSRQHWGWQNLAGRKTRRQAELANGF